jgi:hypothetical protein
MAHRRDGSGMNHVPDSAKKFQSGSRRVPERRWNLLFLLEFGMTVPTQNRARSRAEVEGSLSHG